MDRPTSSGPLPESYDATCAFCEAPNIVDVTLQGAAMCARCAAIYWRGAREGAAHQRGLMAAVLPPEVREKYLSHVKVHEIPARGPSPRVARQTLPRGGQT